MSKENIEELQKDEEPFGLGCALELFAEVNEVAEMIDNLKNIIKLQQSQVERAYERFMYILGQYQEQPHLIDSHIDMLLEKLINIVRDPHNSMDLKHETFKYMYVIINVRGYKVIIRHLPHEVADFEPVLQLLELQNPNDSKTWTTRYVLLLWLSIIVIIPFHMSRLDGFEEHQKKTVMDRMMEICKIYVVVADKCRDAASHLNARFLTRSDVKEQHLDLYLLWAMDLAIEKDSSVFVRYGILSSIAMLLKHGKRDDLLPYAPILLQWIINAEFKDNPGTNIQKFVYKIIQRIGLTFLPPRIATWRYNRGNRSLAANLSAGDGKTTTTTAAAAQSINNIEEDEDIDVPDEIEEVIDQLIHGLRSNDGIVRWSAAKGIGRVTGRLSKDLADDVVGSVLELFNPREGDGAWHGGCLALAELGRRGLLLPQRLPEVVPVVIRALTYDEPRGYSSVGSHIRDAACYVSWSFARAYDWEVLQSYVQDIASALLIVACFDREINCRRAASAAFQENVGRQGTFPHGIDILTTADFFAVSIRNNAYLIISVYIAQFQEYTIPLIDHLIERKVDHWDIVIRELTAKALHNLTPLASDYVIRSVLPQLFDKATSIDLNARHGSVTSIGEILHALSKLLSNNGVKLKDYIGNELVEKTQNLVPLFQERLYFRGLGGELMRQACCNFIENCSYAQMPFHNSNSIDVWLKLLDECLSYNVDNIRIGAVTALSAFLSEYYSYNTDECIKRQEVVIRGYLHELESETCEVTRMGHALALGSMPSFMLKNHLNEIISYLIKSTVITIETLKWAEGRRDSIKALTAICVTLESDIQTAFTSKQIDDLYYCFFEGLHEYTQDKRGDIGAWVRESSMSALQTLTTLFAKHNSQALTTTLVAKVIANIAQQAVEKIDRTRALAGRIFYSFIHSELAIPNIPHHEELKEIFCKEECDMLNWNSAAVTFPKFVQLLKYDEYTYNVLLGLVSSVGGMTETLVRSSSSSLYGYFDNLQPNKKTEIERLCDIIYSIFAQFQRNDRIIVPILRFLDKLMCSGRIHLIIDDPNSEFSKKILKLVQLEINGCKDIYKLVDGINLLCQFIQIKTEVCSTALVQLSILLCHRQTYVRRSTSTKLYESLLVYGDNSIIPIENLDEIMNLLSNTNWEDPVDVIKPIRNQLCTLMGVRIPVPKKK